RLTWHPIREPSGNLFCITLSITRCYDRARQALGKLPWPHRPCRGGAESEHSRRRLPRGRDSTEGSDSQRTQWNVEVPSESPRPDSRDEGRLGRSLSTSTTRRRFSPTCRI